MRNVLVLAPTYLRAVDMPLEKEGRSHLKSEREFR
jgi:hypothetical protein